MTNEIIVEDRSVVVPGETLSIGMNYLPGYGAHRVNEEIRSSIIGLVNIKDRVIKVIPLSGAYYPKKGDKVIGQVVDVGRSAWDIDIKAPLVAFLTIADATRSYIELGEDLSRYYGIGDYVYAEVASVSRTMDIRLQMKDRMFKKLSPAMIVEISPVKVPRIIGKKGSMINVLKEETKCSFIVGQNGLVWIKGENREDELLASKAIKFIEKNAHVSGLTDGIKEKIKEWRKK